MTFWEQYEYVLHIIPIVALLSLTAYIIIKAIVKPSLKVPDECDKCTYCKTMIDKFSNGLPVKYCEFSKKELPNRNLNRPIARTIEWMCSDYKLKKDDRIRNKTE